MAKNRYEDGNRNFEKFSHRKTKSKSKGHQSRHQNDAYWNNILNDPDTVDTDQYEDFHPSFSQSQNTPHFTRSSAQSQHPQKAPFTPEFGPNTHDFKNFKIDFDRVASMECIENVLNGLTTYGIKFIFTGKKAAYKIAWYNKDKALRDRIFTQEYEFWTGLPSYLKNIKDRY